MSPSKNTVPEYRSLKLENAVIPVLTLPQQHACQGPMEEREFHCLNLNSTLFRSRLRDGVPMPSIKVAGNHVASRQKKSPIQSLKGCGAVKVSSLPAKPSWILTAPSRSKPRYTGNE